jgi:hypothetical protein
MGLWREYSRFMAFRKKEKQLSFPDNTASTNARSPDRQRLKCAH